MPDLTKGQKQRLFPLFVARLLNQAYILGYEVSFGECYRTPEQAALNVAKGIGIANSLHTQRLAIDLNLFKDGIYLTNSTDYKPLGDYWKTLHSLARWGGDFTKIVNGQVVPTPDGCHFSFEHDGVK